MIMSDENLWAIFLNSSYQPKSFHLLTGPQAIFLESMRRSGSEGVVPRCDRDDLFMKALCAILDAEGIEIKATEDAGTGKFARYQLANDISIVFASWDYEDKGEIE